MCMYTVYFDIHHVYIIPYFYVFLYIMNHGSYVKCYVSHVSCIAGLEFLKYDSINNIRDN